MKTKFLYIFGAAGVLSIILIMTPITRAATVNVEVPDQVLNAINAGKDQALNLVTTEVQKNVSGSGSGKLLSDLGTDLKNIWNSLDAWLQDKAGISLGGIIKGIGGIFIVVLRQIINLINWLLSLIK